MDALPPLPDAAALAARLALSVGARTALLDSLHAEGTDCYRLLHGAVEGLPGLTVDRYGPLLVIQTFRSPLPEDGLEALHASVQTALGVPLVPVWNHRKGARTARDFDRHHEADAAAEAFHVGREGNLRLAVRGRHRGLDPLHFLDFRVVRRWLQANAGGAEVLNLFSYTCSAGMAAAVGGASRVLDVDFASSALDVGARNARLNGCPRHRGTPPVGLLRGGASTAGLPVKGGRAPASLMRIQPRQFDTLVLDPPTFARSPFGTVDLVRDYPSVLAAAPRHASGRDGHRGQPRLDGSLGGIRADRGPVCEKAGRPGSGGASPPEADFPSPDGQPPLKALLRPGPTSSGRASSALLLHGVRSGVRGLSPAAAAAAAATTAATGEAGG